MNNIKNIRPGHLLSLVDDFPDEVKFFMPQPQGAGSTTVLESILLIKLLRVTQAKKIFEFGTYKGLTTRLLLENYPHHGAINNSDPSIYTLDLPNIEGVTFIASDKDHAAESVRLSSNRKYLLSEHSHLVNQILMDSKKFDASAYENMFQFIFIDANHELSYVKTDTENSLKMLSKNERGCIIWHDYGSEDFPDLTKYISELNVGMNIYHVENTMLAFCLTGIDESPLRR